VANMQVSSAAVLVSGRCFHSLVSFPGYGSSADYAVREAYEGSGGKRVTTPFSVPFRPML
jgi:hypothetical protein